MKAELCSLSAADTWMPVPTNEELPLPAQREKWVNPYTYVRDGRRFLCYVALLDSKGDVRLLDAREFIETFPLMEKPVGIDIYWKEVADG